MFFFLQQSKQIEIKISMEKKFFTIVTHKPVSVQFAFVPLCPRKKLIDLYKKLKLLL